MRKIFILVIASLCALKMSAQTMYIWSHGLAVAATASEAGVMQYINGGKSLLLGSDTLSVAEIDSITIGRAVDASTVSVSYGGSLPCIVIPYALAHTLSVSTDGNNVDIASADSTGSGLKYVLSGESSNGSFALTGDYKCDVILKGLSLTSASDEPAINIMTGKRTRFILQDGTVSFLANTAGGTHKACLYVKGHPEFEGSGVLNVTSLTGHGIASTEYTEVHSGEINILSSAADGIHAKQYFKMTGGTVTTKSCKGDGIQAEISKDQGDEDNGQMLISGGTVTVTGTTDDASALKADSLLAVTGGTVTLDMKGAGVKGMNSGYDIVIGVVDASSAPVIDITVDGGVYTDPVTTETSKTRGIKTDTDLTVYSGKVSVTATGKKSKSIKVGDMGTSSLYSAASVTTNDGYVFSKTGN